LKEKEEIRLRTANDDIETIEPNLLSQLTDEHFQKDFKDYRVKMHERQFYHVAIEDRAFNPSSGKRESYAHVTTFDKPTWANIKNSDPFKAKTTAIIHDPTIEAADAPLVTLHYTLQED
jgi:hypothetical protein